MSVRAPRRTGFLRPALALTVGLVATSFRAAPEEQLRDGDHKKLGKAISDYFTAMNEEEGIADSLADVKKEFDKIQKKSKGTDPLSMVEDVEKALFYAADYPKQKVRKGKGRVDEWAIEHSYFGEIPVAIHAPKSYSGSKGPYGLLLAVPDAGESPRDHLQQQWTNADLLEDTILVAFEMPEDTSLWDQAGDPSAPGGLGLVMSGLGVLNKTFAIDMDRVFLSGRGAAVPAVLSIAAQFPHCFGGVIGRAGDAEGVPATNFANTGTFFAGGGSGATAFEAAVKEAGYDNCTLAADASEEDIWSWMKSTRRDPVPQRVVFAPTSRTSTCFWLQAQGFEPGAARVEATADRSSNTITIDANGVSTVNLFFNDLLVDMDQPIKVVANGTTHEALVPRNLQTMLSNAFNSGDTGRVYTATYSYNLPEGDGTR